MSSHDAHLSGMHADLVHALQESEERHRLLFQYSTEGILLGAPDGRIFQANQVACALLGMPEAEACQRGRQGLMDPADKRVHAMLEERRMNGHARGELRFRRQDGSTFEAEVATSLFTSDNGEQYTTITFRDITDRKRSESIAQARLQLLLFAQEHSLDDLLEETLNEAERLTGSCIGFYHFVEADQKSLTLQNWSRRTKAEFCKAEGKGLHYAIDQAGVWVDCVSGREPVIHNDYASLPHKKGMPPGHAQVIRELVVPVMRGDTITAILGVGNKPSDYTRQDVETVAQLADQAWDIAERKRSGETTRMLANTMEEMSEIVVVTDLDAHIRFVNEAFVSTFGYQLEEVIGKHIAILCSPLNPPDVLPTLLARTREGFWAGEMLQRRKDGSDFPIRLRTSVIHDEKGTSLAVAGIGEDITERRKADAALRASEERYKALATTIPDALVAVDVEGRITYASPVGLRMMGFEREEQVLGQSMLRWVEEQSRPAVLQELQEVLQGKRVSSKEYVIQRDEGSRFFAEVSSTRMVGSGGEVTGTIMVLRDVTERKNLEEQLMHAQKMEAIGRLAGGIAHDFNNMIGVILGYAKLLENNLNPLDPLFKSVQAIATAAERSANLTRQLLGFARKQLIAPVAVNLNDSLTTVQRMLQRLVGEDITITLHPGENLWNILIDPTQVDQILTNLASNARDAIADVGAIAIATANVEIAAQGQTPDLAPGEYVQITFSDTGCGIRPETLDRIFEPFFTTKPQGQGTGLGLATVFGIVKQNGGSIVAESAVGQGTTFAMRFPRFRGAVESRTELQIEVPVQGTETILVVEDDDQLLNLTCAALELHGYTVLYAHSPGEALLISERFDRHIDLLLTDVVLPEMNGKELNDRLSRSRPTMQTIYMSGHSVDVVAHKGILLEGIAYLQKPFTPQALARKVREVLDVTQRPVM
jgi:two-component system, cell cycle sensor histidine kinase and response regulator CckA